jgi:hypothetical protein
MKTLLKTAFAIATSLAFASTSFAQVIGFDTCETGGVFWTGPTDLAQISSTGNAQVPCLVTLHSYQSRNIGNLRGRTNYIVDSSPSRHAAQGAAEGSATARKSTLEIYAISKDDILNAGANRNDGGNSTLFFAMRLADNSKLVLESVWRDGGKYLAVKRVIRNTNEVIQLGEIAAGSRGQAQFTITLVAQRNNLRSVELASDMGGLTIDVNATLTGMGLNGWQYGMLDDTDATNINPVTLLLNHGPRPFVN